VNQKLYPGCCFVAQLKNIHSKICLVLDKLGCYQDQHGEERKRKCWAIIQKLIISTIRSLHDRMLSVIVTVIMIWPMIHLKIVVYHIS